MTRCFFRLQPLINKLFYDVSCTCRGSLIGHPVENIRIVLTDGASHAVDSSELAFKLAAIYAFRQVATLASLGLLSFLNELNPHHRNL